MKPFANIELLGVGFEASVTALVEEVEGVLALSGYSGVGWFHMEQEIQSSYGGKHGLGHKTKREDSLILIS